MNPLPIWTGYACAVAAVALCTLLGLTMTERFDIVNIAMVYLLAVVVIALRFSRGAAVTSAVLCVLAFDFAFVPPQLTLTVDDAQYLLTFAIMLAVALTISYLMERGRQQIDLQARLAVEAQTERIRSTLLASISHDLRTPLAVIAGASSSLLQAGDRMSRTERDALALSIYQQSRATAEQVNKVLQMTRLEASAMELELEWVSIDELAGAVLSRFAELSSAHPVTRSLPAELPLVRVDAALIDQALSNLIENAIRHTPAGTPIHVKAELADQFIRVSVEDHGAGLSQDETEQIFAKFHRGTASAHGGVGLGLAILRAIIRLHGGQAWAERLPGGGSAFRFTLPVVTPPPTPVEVDGG